MRIAFSDKRKAFLPFILISILKDEKFHKKQISASYRNSLSLAQLWILIRENVTLKMLDSSVLPLSLPLSLSLSLSLSLCVRERAWLVLVWARFVKTKCGSVLLEPVHNDMQTLLQTNDCVSNLTPPLSFAWQPCSSTPSHAAANIKAKAICFKRHSL